MMTVGSLFSGAGGFDLGLEQAGFEIVWQVEKDAHARKVLAKHWPTVQQFDDVCQFHGWAGGQGGIYRVQGGSIADAQRCGEWNQSSAMRIDCLVGGWPCQDISLAGKRKGLAGERSGLFHEVIRIAKEIQPTWGLFENVPGLFSSHGGRDMATVLEGLRQCWPVVGYRVLDSQYFGVAQRRRRVFFVCGPTERSVEEILFEPEGGSGHPAESEKARPELAASLRSRSSSPGINPPSRGGEDDMNLVVSRALCASKSGMRFDPNQENFIVPPITGNGCYGDQIGNESHLVNALTNLGSGGVDDNDAQAGHIVTHALRCEGFDGSEDGTGRGTPLVPMAFQPQASCTQSMNLSSVSPTLGTSKKVGVQHEGVRRLTPTETELLQGFPDGWTCLCQPLESYDHLKCQCADGPRYRMMGNAVTVNVIRWLGRRIKNAAKGTA